MSVQAAVGATVVAIVLGTLLSLAMARFAFFGRETITLLVILPIALPGIITGLALQSTYTTAGISFGLVTIIIGHATFCIVVVFNNAVARLRRLHGNLEEASKDLGADSWQTFRHVTFPQLRTALLAGALLAFALSWDEVVVTIFTSGAEQTLPIWIFANLFRPIEQPIVNVVALFVIVVSVIPVYIATRLASDVTTDRPGQGRRGGRSRAGGRYAAGVTPVAAGREAAASGYSRDRKPLLRLPICATGIGQATPVPPSPQ